MKRRSFIGALAATFATPAKMLAAPAPVVPSGLIDYGCYSMVMHRRLAKELLERAQPIKFMPMFKGEIGRYESIRFIRSDLC
jgi:hypothetical protein